MSTRKRNVSIQFYLNAREADLLDRKVKATGLSRTVFLRHLVNGFQPRELPPPDYRDLMNALYGNRSRSTPTSTPRCLRRC